MITLRVKINEYLQVEACDAKLKRISVDESDDGLLVRIKMAVDRKDFCPSTPTWLSVSNGQKTQSFDARIVSIDYDNGIAEFVMDVTLDGFLFFVPTIWRDFVRDAIVKFRDAAFDPSLRG